jgi:hypothetical protein
MKELNNTRKLGENLENGKIINIDLDLQLYINYYFFLMIILMIN